MRQAKCNKKCRAKAMKTLNNYYIMIYDKMTILKYPVFSQILRKKAFKNWLQCKRSVLAGGGQEGYALDQPTDKTLRLVRQANLNAFSLTNLLITGSKNHRCHFICVVNHETI